ncbi:hypothetical protein OFC56_39095, partial [Escherichia coli]|nr:hypothetical protein [Escherichia coli]
MKGYLLKIQAVGKMKYQRKRYLALRASAILSQSYVRAALGCRFMADIRQASSFLQSYVRQNQVRQT